MCSFYCLCVDNQSTSFKALPRTALCSLFQELTGEVMQQQPELGVADLISFVLAATVKESLSNCGVADGVLIVCGTGYIMPHVRLALGIVEPRCVVLLSQYGVLINCH